MQALMARPVLRVLRRERKGDSTLDEALSPDQFEASFKALGQRLREFRDDREWEKFHTPRNLAMSVSIEAGELLEQFQWLPDDRPLGEDDLDMETIREEVADVVIYVVQLAEVLGLGLGAAIESKIELNEERYPASVARGSSVKYSELPPAEARSSA